MKVELNDCQLLMLDWILNYELTHQQVEDCIFQQLLCQEIDNGEKSYSDDELREAIEQLTDIFDLTGE